MDTPDPGQADRNEPHEYRVLVDGITLAYAGPNRGEALRAYFFHELWGGSSKLTKDGKPDSP